MAGSQRRIHLACAEETETETERERQRERETERERESEGERVPGRFVRTNLCLVTTGNIFQCRSLSSGGNTRQT